MKSLRRFKKDHLGGALLVVLGLGILFQGSTYRFGNLTNMGPGFMPVVFGIALVLVGALVGLTAEGGDFQRVGAAEWRGWLCIIASVFAFALFGVFSGLVLASFAVVFISALGDRTNSIRDALLLAIGLTAFGVAVFSYGLRMAIPLFSWGS
jgi:hypothetical protein